LAAPGNGAAWEDSISARNNVLGLIVLMAALAFTIFAAKRLLLRRAPLRSDVDILLENAKPVPKRSMPKPSAAVPAQTTPAASSTPSTSSSPAASSPPQPSSPATSKGQEQVATSTAGGADAAPAKAAAPAVKSNAPAKAPETKSTAPAKAPAPAVKSAAPAESPRAEVHPPEVHRSENSRPEERRTQLRFAGGVRLWIHVTAISRKPDGNFTFRGTLLQPVELANTNQLAQDTELSGSGKVNNGHVTVRVAAFTVGGANYALQDASGSSKHPGTGLAVELDPGKLLEVWLASSSVYRKTP
jgi:hypothetical protein